MKSQPANSTFSFCYLKK